MAISIFAKRAYLNTHPSEDFVSTGTPPPTGYLKRVSSIIRADQVSAAIGAKLNPAKGFAKDICIYVKPELDASGDFKFAGTKTYIDVVDEIGYTSVLKKHPGVFAIVCSERDLISLATAGISPDRIALIPQHHCNFDRAQRTRKEVATVGVIGIPKAFPFLPADLESRLAERKINFIKFSRFFTRQDIVDFYQHIDVQIVWRPYRKKLANPLKIVNAASFGIPTLALDEIYFKEMGNCYIGVRDLDHFLLELDLLRTLPQRYAAFAGLCLKKAEEYHIDHITKLYQKL